MWKKKTFLLLLALFMLPAVSVSADQILVPTGIRASSTLYDGVGDYSPWYTQDTDAATAWVEGAPGNGAGEYLAFDLPEGTIVTGLFLSPGYLKSEDLFYKNGAPASLLVYSGLFSAAVDCSAMAATYVANSDVNWGNFYFDTPVVSSGTVYVEIGSVREGWKYSDTCINELQLLGRGEPGAGVSSYAGAGVLGGTITPDELPETFTFASGVGGWHTDLSFYDDWYFKGRFQDSNMGETGPGYPGGTTYESDYAGFLTEPEALSDHAFRFQLFSMIHNQREGEERFEDGIRYVGTTPYGLWGGDEFILYRPGTPMTELTEDCISWLGAFFDCRGLSSLPAGVYVFYNVSEGYAFVGQK